MSIIFKVQKNEKYGDYRVGEYIDGELWQEHEGNWTKENAVKAKNHLLKTEGLTFFGL